jgi:hypothetical protein
MVSGTSQRVQLNKTALVTATYIISWADRLKDEMKKQNIDRHAEQLPEEGDGIRRSKYAENSYPTDDKEVITFERGQIRRLLDEMAEQVRELRRFEEKTPRRPT